MPYISAAGHRILKSHLAGLRAEDGGRPPPPAGRPLHRQRSGATPLILANSPLLSRGADPTAKAMRPAANWQTDPAVRTDRGHRTRGPVARRVARLIRENARLRADVSELAATVARLDARKAVAR